MVLGLQSPPRTSFLFLAMELPRSVQQLLCHQFDLDPTCKARIIYRDYCRGHFALRKRAPSPARHVLEDTSHQNRPKIDGGDAYLLMGSIN